jgi:hypothetical protein
MGATTVEGLVAHVVWEQQQPRFVGPNTEPKSLFYNNFIVFVANTTTSRGRKRKMKRQKKVKLDCTKENTKIHR